ncbi:LDCC motif putative metal-binding protein [Thermosediminibacter oceani]|uniref:Uncharacterized protein n=1 Tax=Thermosediminibacter oceani (strain ATCC BAA-1034 / DSM 16646 / JW/IW-1228P) TaxID=555079 RepID=D9S263_THEOJ|nr:LDCC motif putative metal-binding protein [Thermosediminibacter oceani]ADL07490.1 conserved hypothetical protein [Thermosediminibacter oceani DSM 16646]
MAGWLKRFLENLAKVNEKEFGGKKMDCCELHRTQEKRPVNNNKKNTK